MNVNKQNYVRTSCVKHVIFHSIWVSTKFQGQNQTNVELLRFYSEIHFCELIYVLILYITSTSNNFLTIFNSISTQGTKKNRKIRTNQ